MENRRRNINQGCFPKGARQESMAAGEIFAVNAGLRVICPYRSGEWKKRGTSGLVRLLPFLAVIGTLFLALPSFAQSPKKSDSLSLDPAPASTSYWRVGALIALGLSAHDVTLDIYQSSPGCGTFTDQISTTSFARLFLETPLLSSLGLSLTAGLTVQNRSINFTENFNTISRHPDGRIDQIITQQRLDASIVGYGPFAGIEWEPVRNLRLGIAPSFLFMRARDIRQYEEIVAPFGAVFTETGDYQRPIDRGGSLAFNEQGVDLSFWAGAAVPLGEHLMLMPEVGANILLTSLEQSTPWRTMTGYFGLGLAWDQKGEREPIQKIDPPEIHVPVEPVAALPPQKGSTETAPKEGPVTAQEHSVDPAKGLDPNPPLKEAHSFRVEISAVGIDRKNREYPDPVIEIREAPWSQSIALIPYIFFDSGSTAIPARYEQFADPVLADRFNPDSLIGPTPLSLHRQLLNVLGQRLRARPEVAVTIVGTTSGEEGKSAEERNRLAAARGEAVRGYFKRIWGIDEHRITVVAGKATNPSSEETADGRAENRRAEFLFDGESLVRPVVVERLARIASPPAIKFYPRLYKDSSATVAVADWHITVMQGEKELLRIEGARNDSLTFERKYWSLGDMRVNHDLTPIRYRLEVRDTAGQVATAENSFIVREQTTRTPEAGDDLDLEIKEFLLVGFPYNSAELRPSHIAEIHEIARIADRGSWVDVTGFTDRVGDAQRNHELAMERARGVADTLRTIRSRLSLPEIPISAVRGLGEAGEGIYDNNFPEGRIFSRMVRVTVNRRPR